MSLGSNTGGMPGRTVSETVPVTDGPPASPKGELRTPGNGCPPEQAEPPRTTRTNQRMAEGKDDLRIRRRLQDRTENRRHYRLEAFDGFGVFTVTGGDAGRHAG